MIINYKKNNLKNILWASKTGDANSWYHIMPFKKCKLVGDLHVVRYKKPKRLINDINYHTFSNKNKFIEIFYYSYSIVKILLARKIDLVVSFNPFPWGLISFIFAKITRKPILLGLIGGELEPSRTSKIKRFLLLKILKHVNIITVTGVRTKNQLLNLGFNKDKVFVFPHLVDSEYLKHNKDTSFKSDMITITSFLPVKRTIDSINAVSILKKEGYNFNLTILGDGPDISFCKKIAKKLNVEENINFVGFVDDIRPYINNSQYYIQTSSSEGLSIALLESMATGLIPIVTNVGDEKEVIKNNYTGFFINVNNPKQIANKIKALDNSNLKNEIKLNIKEKMNNLSIEYSDIYISEILKTIKNN